MAVGLYADVHVPGPVILQLRLRGVKILAVTGAEYWRNRVEQLPL